MSLDGVALAGWDKDGVARSDPLGFRPDGDHAVPLEYEIEFLAGEVVVGTRGRAGRKGGLGEALILHRGVGLVEDASDGGAVFGCEWGLAG